MIELHLGDCLEVMKSIPDKSVDLVLTDPPYGTTACKWDSVIPFDPMWAELKTPPLCNFTFNNIFIRRLANTNPLVGEET